MGSHAVPLGSQAGQKAWVRCCMAAVLLWVSSGFIDRTEGTAAERHQDIRIGVQRMVVGQYGWTALMEAAGQGDLAAVRDQLSKKSDVNVQAIDGSTALKVATDAGHVDVVNALLAHGADVNRRDKTGRTPLSDAVLHGHAAIASLLLEKGADPNVKTAFGEPVLIAALQSGREHIISALLEKGADIRTSDRHGRSAFLLAAENGLTPIVHLLLKKGADPNQQDPFGNHALILAAGKVHAPIVELLLKHGADVHLANQSGDTAFFVSARSGAVDVMTMLLHKGAHANEKTRVGTTALMIAAEKGHLDAVRSLIKNGADVDVVDAEGNTAVVFADWAGHSEIVNVLLRQATGRAPQELQQSPATLLYFQSTKQNCVLQSFTPRDGVTTTLTAVEQCPEDVFVTKEFSTMFLIGESEIAELALKPHVHRAPSTPLPLANTPQGGYGKHRLVQAGSFPDGSLGVLYESPLGEQASDMRLYKFHEGGWTLVDEQQCLPSQNTCLQSPINGQNWRNWSRAKAIWHPRVGRNPLVVKRGVVQEGELSILENRSDYSDNDLGGTWRYLRVKVNQRPSTVFYYVSRGDVGFGPYTFTVFLQRPKDRNAVRIVDQQCDTAIEHKYLLVNEYFGGGLKLIDLETGEEPVTGLQYAFWNAN